MGIRLAELYSRGRAEEILAVLLTKAMASDDGWSNGRPNGHSPFPAFRTFVQPVIRFIVDDGMVEDVK